MKNILLAVCGLSPQVITETLYALHQDQRQVDAVHVVTTRSGREKIYADLLGGKSGRYHQYLRDYGLSPSQIAFDHDHIHVVADENGNEIADITDEKDNERLLKKCLDLTFHLSKSPDNAIFFSIAGGRKTMSACLSLAAQMYGRPQDRMYHVLVSPEFESNRDFYYPPKICREIELFDEKRQPYVKKTEYARITLVPLPFVSIRDQLSSDMLKRPKDPATLMLSLIKEEPARLVVNLVDKKIVFKKMEQDLMPAPMALYAFFADRKKACKQPGENCGACTDCFLELSEVLDMQEKITGIYKIFCGSRPVDEMSDSGITELNDRNFNSYKSKVNRVLRNKFGVNAVRDMEISSIGQRPNTRFGIRMDKDRIEVVY